MTTLAMSSSWLSFLADDSASRARVTRSGTTKQRTIGERARALDANQDGAVMLMGLCMACFLIGSLWTIIGIGDAIVFRDQMQEVADHAAFTSAALHAKGMNFISACNLVMMAIIFFHILLGLIQDVLFLACLIPIVDIVACPAFDIAHDVYVTYANDVMKPAVIAIHYAEEVAGYGYPWLGALKGYTLGTDYGHDLSVVKRDLHVIAVSPSLVPGTALDALINSAFAKDSPYRRDTGQTAGEKLGLPVSPKGYNEICKHIAEEGLSTLIGFLHVQFLSKVAGALKSLVGDAVQFRYCNSLGYTGPGQSTESAEEGAKNKPNVGDQVSKANAAIDKANKKIDENNANHVDAKGNPLPADAKPQPDIKHVGGASAAGDAEGAAGDAEGDEGDEGAAIDPGFQTWWGENGPYYVWGGTSNGAAWNEIWALNLNPAYTDQQQHAVSIAQRKFGVTSTAQAPFAYVAEAEFYFACKDKWTDEECNADGNASYSVQWRARLRRTEFPGILSMIGSFGGDFLGNLGKVSGMFEEIADKVQKALPVNDFTKALVPSLVDQAKEKAQDWVTDEAKDLGESADKALFGGLADGIYH